MWSVFWRKVSGAFTNHEEAYINDEVEEWEETLQESQKAVKEIEKEIAQCFPAIKRAKRGQQCLLEEWECLRMSCHDSLENPILLLGQPCLEEDNEDSSGDVTALPTGEDDATGRSHRSNKKSQRRGNFIFRIYDGALERVRQEVCDTDSNGEDEYGSEGVKTNEHNEREETDHDDALLMTDKPHNKRKNDPIINDDSSISGDDVDDRGAFSYITVAERMTSVAVPAVRKRTLLDLTKLVASDFPSDADDERMSEEDSEFITITKSFPTIFERWKVFLKLQQCTAFLDSHTCRDELFGATHEIIEGFENRVFDLQLKLMELKALETVAVHEMRNVNQVSNTEEVDRQSRLMVLTDSVDNDERIC